MVASAELSEAKEVIVHPFGECCQGGYAGLAPAVLAQGGYRAAYQALEVARA
jgi:hypothetical protein